MTTASAEFLQLMGAEPFALLDELREGGPVVPVAFPDGMDRWVVTRYEDARAVLADDGRFRSDLTGAVAELRGPTAEVVRKFQALLSKSVLSTDAPVHTRLRKAVVRAFSARRVDALRPRVTELAEQLLDAVRGRAEIDLVADFAFPLPVLVICELLGVPAEDRDHFSSLSQKMLGQLVDPESVQEASAAIDGLTSYMAGLIGEKQLFRGDDLLSDLVELSQDGDRLSSEELLAMAVLLLNAGHETTVNLIGNGMALLLRAPHLLDRLRARPDLVPRAVEEFLRLDGPVAPGLVRHAVEAAEIGGVTVPAGALVLVSLPGGNRDPRHFPAPEEFRLDRPDPGHHLAFGHGVHFCVGARLARLEAEIAFTALLRRYPEMSPAGEPRRRPGALLRGYDTLPVRVG
ncbi:cytochrome P450 [Crossiella equi]|uniref:Cytochrome P450 n=1 Tax=Crossiella equi TaxID=130796 RepID=A0ABS5AK67_9PSEU|nr:cytochrome P450 [Crossiella equi]MBP2476604.1 cytochrome P450 [Crossiella equi]